MSVDLCTGADRPSVVIWSLGNEIFYADIQAGDPSGSGSAGYCRGLAALVRSLDGTRPITEGGDAYLDARPAVLDMADVHYADAIPAGAVPPGLPASYVQSIEKARALFPHKPMVQSESYPASVYTIWKRINATDWLIGDFVWTAWDYIGEAAIGAPPLSPSQTKPGYPWYLSDCGDVDLIGQRKPQSYWRSVVWGLSELEMAEERPTPTGTTQSGNNTAFNWGYYDELRSWTWDVPTGQETTVRVYTSGDTVTLSLDGTTLATNPVSERDQLVTTFTVPYAPGTLTAVASKRGKELARMSLKTVGAPAKLRLTPDVRHLAPDRDKLAYVLVEVLDSTGRIVPDAVVPITFAVSGSGALIGVANANPHNVDSFTRPRRYTYHGQALVILRPATKRGTIELSASAPGLTSTTLAIEVRRAKQTGTDQSRRNPWPVAHGPMARLRHA